MQPIHPILIPNTPIEKKIISYDFIGCFKNALNRSNKKIEKSYKVSGMGRLKIFWVKSKNLGEGADVMSVHGPAGPFVPLGQQQAPKILDTIGLGFGTPWRYPKFV